MDDRRVFDCIPLVRHLFDRESRLLQYRGIDNRWFYDKTCPIVMGGFNPFLKRIMVPNHSALGDWLGGAEVSVRDLNYEDRLVREILFAVHDYIHIWAWDQIEKISPELVISSTRFPIERCEEYVFALLLTEAAATVGLDYWYLSTVDLNELLNIGTTVTNLTVSFHEKYASEYRKFYDDLEVQRPTFFADLVRFYCSGVFKGFSAQDICRSPLLARWLIHELKYGKVQRVGSRRWFRYLHSRSEDSSPGDDRGVNIDAPWQENLILELGERLWTFVKHGRVDPVADTVPMVWRSPTTRHIDFRYRNVRTCQPALWANGRAKCLSGRSRRYLCYQLISVRRHDSADVPAVSELAALLNGADVDALASKLDKLELVDSSGEPRDLIFAN